MRFTKQDFQNLETFLRVRKEGGDIEKKYAKKIQKYCSVFRFIPGILFVGIGNSVAMNAATKKSDIDLFIITQANALWFVRVFMTTIVMLTGNRKTHNNHAGKICLSFFCTEEALDFENIALEKDIYLYYWILTLKPILIKGNIYEKFIEENSWVDFKAYQNIHENNFCYLQYDVSENKRENILVAYLDRVFKRILLPRSMKKYEKLGKPEGVIMSDTMLKFHDKDKRAYIREKVLEKN